MKTVCQVINEQGETFDLAAGFYQNGSLALMLFKSGEPFYKITVNANRELPKRKILVKTYSENEGIEWLLKTGYFQDTNERIPVGYVQLQVWSISEQLINLIKKQRTLTII